MTAFARLAVRFRTVTLLVVGLVLAAGALSAGALQRELFPPVEPPYLVVTAALPGAAPTEVVDELTTPLEEVVEASTGLEHVQSSTQESVAVVFAEYAYGTDIDERRREILDGLADTTLPEGATEPVVQALSPDSLPIYSLAVSGPADEVREFTNDRLVPELEGISGVAQVDVSGADEPVVRIDLDPQRLAEHSLTVLDVTQALETAGLSVPVGSVTEGDAELPVRVSASVEEVADILVPPSAAAQAAAAQAAQAAQATQVAQAGQAPQGAAAPTPTPPAPVRLGDLGTVEEETAPTAETISRLDGEPAVVVQVLKTQDGNTVDVIDEIETVLEDLDTPAGVDLTTVVDQAPEIRSGISDVARDAMIGALLAIVMVAIFLRSGRGTLVAGVSIPLSLIAALALMRVADISLNILTLGALAVAAGRVIDDSIVVLENIYRNLELGKPRARAVRDGTAEVAGAVTSATLTAVAVFLPLGFIGGLAGEVFIGFALTTTFALAASLLVALGVVPVLGSLLLRRAEAEKAEPENSPLRRMMRRSLQWALAHRAATLSLVVLAVVGSLASLLVVPVNLFPTVEPDTAIIEIEMAPDTILERQSELVADLETQVAEVDGVEYFTTRVGRSTEGGLATLGADGDATLTVAISDDADADEVIDELGEVVEASGLDGVVAGQQLIPGGTDVLVQVTGDDFAAIQDATVAVAAALRDIEGLEDVRTNLEESRRELAVSVDERALAERGLSAGAVAQLLRTGLAEPTITTVPVDGTERDLVVRFAPDAVDGAAALEDLPLAPGVALGDVADVEEADSPTGISRYDGSRSAEVTGTITDPNVGGVTADVQAALDDLDLPEGVEVQAVGGNEEIGEAFRSMFVAMGIAVALTYLILVGSFGSLVLPLVILLSLPLASVGAFPALALTGRELGLPALIGLLMLIGIVVTNAIVLLQFVEQLRAAGRSTRDALVEGAEIRVRPILMTALTTIFGLVPLALGLSEGALLSASLATVVIGGLLSSTLLTLIVIPVVYSFTDRVRRRRGEEAEIGEPEPAAQPAAAPVGARPAAVPTEPPASPEVAEVAPVPPPGAAVVGAYASPSAAQHARRRLAELGFDPDRLAVVRAPNGSRGREAPLTRLARSWLARRDPAALAPPGERFGVAVPDALADAARDALRQANGART